MYYLDEMILAQKAKFTGKTQPAEVNGITILQKIIDRLGAQSSGGYISLTPTLKLVKQD
jgi:hypothetical protein